MPLFKPHDETTLAYGTAGRPYVDTADGAADQAHDDMYHADDTAVKVTH
jgi:hypothetical protein